MFKTQPNMTISSTNTHLLYFSSFHHVTKGPYNFAAFILKVVSPRAMELMFQTHKIFWSIVFKKCFKCNFKRSSEPILAFMLEVESPQALEPMFGTRITSLEVAAQPENALLCNVNASGFYCTKKCENQKQLPFPCCPSTHLTLSVVSLKQIRIRSGNSNK